MQSCGGDQCLKIPFWSNLLPICDEAKSSFTVTVMVLHQYLPMIPSVFETTMAVTFSLLNSCNLNCGSVLLTAGRLREDTKAVCNYGIYIAQE